MQTHYPIKTIKAKHCQTCCCKIELPMRANHMESQSNLCRAGENPLLILGSHVNGEMSQQVGQNVIKDRIVWSRVTSSRPSRITIRISTPDRPNLRSSEYYSRSHQKIHTQIQQKSIRLSRMLIQPQRFITTPTKQSKITNQVSTRYSSPFSEKRLSRIDGQNSIYYQ